MADLRAQDNGQLSTRLRKDPLRHMRALEAACHDIASEHRPGYDKNGTCRPCSVCIIITFKVH